MHCEISFRKKYQFTSSEAKSKDEFWLNQSEINFLGHFEKFSLRIMLTKVFLPSKVLQKLEKLNEFVLRKMVNRLIR